MQVFPYKPSILEDSKRCGMFRLLARRHVQKILEAIIDMPRSPVEICSICNIGISTVYRTLGNLSKYKLVKITGSIGTGGKKVYLYQSKIRSIMITLNSDCGPSMLIFGTKGDSNTT
jgi:hypothetical protein